MDQVCAWVQEVHDRGRSPLVVVAEGFIPEGEDVRKTVAVRGTDMVRVPVEEALAGLEAAPPPDRWDEAEVLVGR